MEERKNAGGEVWEDVTEVSFFSAAAHRVRSEMWHMTDEPHGKKKNEGGAFIMCTDFVSGI